MALSKITKWVGGVSMVTITTWSIISSLTNNNFIVPDSQSSDASLLSTSNLSQSSTSTTSIPTAAPIENQAIASPTTTPTANKSESYTAKGNYKTPSGNEEVGVNITISNGVISNVSITNIATNNESSSYTYRFASSISSKVVGKTLDEAKNVSRVGGASETTKGFKSALTTIIAQAK